MRTGTALSIALACLAGSAACGSSESGGGVAINAFTGTVEITGALPAGATCVSTQTVTFSNTATDIHLLTVPGGGCVRFFNGSTTDHWPSANPANGCTEMNAPARLTPGSEFITPRLGGPKTCYWMDGLNPPGGGGGGGGH
ncbi:MAG TPA: hypothetical protein VH880_10230 [Anaeromyxobacteraceae bacterium]|jgi:hypothetical protein